MPDYDPPTNYTGTPHKFLLPADTIVWRLHRQRLPATQFDPFDPMSGGRFDAPPDDPYAKCETGTDAGATLAEVLLRSFPSDGRAFRTVRRASVRGLRASAIMTARDLHLVSLLDGPALAAVAQCRWLITAEWTEFPRVQRWAKWIRSHSPWAHGFIWPAPRNANEQLVIMFGDRCAENVLDPDPVFEVDLDDKYGAVWLQGVLVRYRATINPPKQP